MARPGKHPVSPVDPLSSSYRESDAGIWRNRVGVTSLLFGVAMSLSYLLGRPRR